MSNGKGKFVFADGSRYEGDFKNDQGNGKGKFTLADKVTTFEG